MFRTYEFYCKKCREVRPHELSEDGQRARCITCSQSQRQLAFDRAKYSDTNRHIAALDGMGNRGEAAPRSGRKGAQ
jgi:ribosomal protein L44E